MIVYNEKTGKVEYLIPIVRKTRAEIAKMISYEDEIAADYRESPEYHDASENPNPPGRPADDPTY